jgi:methionyl-tRNA formyltransferase
LEALIEAGHEICAVVTQPDRPKGRSGKPIFSPVKEVALLHKIPVWQPERIKRKHIVRELNEIAADIFVVAAYGQILSKEILEIPRYGCINIHASLLPRYRGASPIQHALLNGDEKTGITIMQMAEGIDTGPMLLTEELAIAPDDTSETLGTKLSHLGAVAITKALELLVAGELVPTKQNEAQAVYAPLIPKEMGRLDFSKSADSLERLVRAMNPWPSAFTTFRGKQMKLWRVQAVETLPCATDHTPQSMQTRVSDPPGTLIEGGKDSFFIVCGQGFLRVMELQMEGKRKMSAREFLQGTQIRTQQKERVDGK